MSSSVAYLSDVATSFESWSVADDPGSSLHTELRGYWNLARDGDRSAFDAIVLELAEPLQRYARRFATSQDVAEDIVQDVFVHLWTNRASLSIRGTVRGYLYQAVRNRALDLRKSHIAEATRIQIVYESSDYLLGGHESPDADLALYRAELAKRVADAFATLSPRTREVALLRWRDGLGRAEIGTIMGTAVATVNNQLTQAARVMRQLLSDLRSE